MSVPPDESLVPSSTSHPTAAQRQLLWTALTALAVAALLAVAGLVFYGFIAFLSWCYPILLPIGLAVIIALLLEPVVSLVQKRGLHRQSAALLVCVLSVVAVLLFWAFLSQPLIEQAGNFFHKLPEWLNDGVDKLQKSMAEIRPKSVLELETASPTTLSPTTNHFSVVSPALTGNLTPAPDLHENFVAGGAPSPFQLWLKTNLPAIEDTLQKNVANLVYAVIGPVGQAFGFLLGFGFVPIYVYYFLADQEQIARHWHEYVPLRRSPLREEVISVLAEISQSLVGYFRGQIVVAACNGVLTFIGLWIIGVPYSLVLGIITGALSIVPFLGIVCSIIPALLLGFLSAQNDATLQWLRPVLVLVVFAVVQLSESMFITPRVQSHSTGLHPLTIILGILFWSALLPGLLGPVVAVPLTCAVVVLLQRYIWPTKAELVAIRKARNKT